MGLDSLLLGLVRAPATGRKLPLKLNDGQVHGQRGTHGTFELGLRPLQPPRKQGHQGAHMQGVVDAVGGIALVVVPDDGIDQLVGTSLAQRRNDRHTLADAL